MLTNYSKIILSEIQKLELKIVQLHEDKIFYHNFGQLKNKNTTKNLREFKEFYFIIKFILHARIL